MRPISRADMQYSSWIAEIYALLGEKDLALEWLAHSVERGFVPWPYFAQHDRLDEFITRVAKVERVNRPFKR